MNEVDKIALEQHEILQILNHNYDIVFTDIEFYRDGGNLTYTVLSDETKYFLKVIRPTFLTTAVQSADIHLYLQNYDFAVPPIILTKDEQPYIKTGKDDTTNLLILYEYIAGDEPTDEDVENVGELVGRFHNLMESYPNELEKQDKHFFIGRYIDILRSKNHDRIDEYEELAEKLWEKVKNLPRSYCHCDLYIGNIFKTESDKLYVLDFDTSCNAFPVYDITLFCDRTSFFEYSDEGYEKSKMCLERFLKGYLKHRSLTKEEIAAVHYFRLIYHYQLQATIVEIHGINCNDDDFEDKQLDWLKSYINKAKAEANINL